MPLSCHEGAAMPAEDVPDHLRKEMTSAPKHIFTQRSDSLESYGLNIFVREMGVDGTRRSVAKKVRVPREEVKRYSESITAIADYFPVFKMLVGITGYQNLIAVMIFLVGLISNLATNVVYMVDAQSVDLLTVGVCVDTVMVGAFFCRFALFVYRDK